MSNLSKNLETAYRAIASMPKDKTECRSQIDALAKECRALRSRLPNGASVDLRQFDCSDLLDKLAALQTYHDALLKAIDSPSKPSTSQSKPAKLTHVEVLEAARQYRASLSASDQLD